MRVPTVNLLCALVVAAAGTSAGAQDLLAEARASYGGVTGEWASPGENCADPADTWRFDVDGVRAGSLLFDLRGIGGSPYAIQLDLVSRQTGHRMPLAVSRSGEALSVRGSGLSAVLLPCDGQGTDVARLGPPTSEWTPSPVAPSAPGGLGPVYNQDGILPPLIENDGGASAEASFAADLTGAWSRGGARCDWRLGSDRIFADGESYEVVNFSGSAERIGIQALRDDGTPATFTITRTGPQTASVQGRVVGGSEISAALTRC